MAPLTGFAEKLVALPEDGRTPPRRSPAVTNPLHFSAVDALAHRSKMPATNQCILMAASQSLTNITSVLREERLFPPPKDFARRARIFSLAQYRKLYQQSIRWPEKFRE